MTEIKIQRDGESPRGKGKGSLPPVLVGLSYPLALQLHTTVGPEIAGQREVSLQMFLGSLPDAQKINLGGTLLTVNGAAVAVPSSTIPYSPEQTPSNGFFAHELTPNLTIQLLDSSGDLSVIVDGDITTKWTIGAIDMELLDPPY